MTPQEIVMKINMVLNITLIFCFFMASILLLFGYFLKHEKILSAAYIFANIFVGCFFALGIVSGIHQYLILHP